MHYKLLLNTKAPLFFFLNFAPSPRRIYLLVFPFILSFRSSNFFLLRTTLLRFSCLLNYLFSFQFHFGLNFWVSSRSSWEVCGKFLAFPLTFFVLCNLSQLISRWKVFVRSFDYSLTFLIFSKKCSIPIRLNGYFWGVRPKTLVADWELRQRHSIEWNISVYRWHALKRIPLSLFCITPVWLEW